MFVMFRTLYVNTVTMWNTCSIVMPFFYIFEGIMKDMLLLVL